MGDDDGKKPIDEARRRILARRASFVAAALAGVACHDPGGKPEPCLSVVQDPQTDAGPTSTAPAIPSVPPTYEQPATDPNAKPEPAPKPDGGARPAPCLKMRPQVCLKVAKPE